MKNSEQTVDTLQQTINKRAEQRLLKDIGELASVISRQKLLRRNEDIEQPELMFLKPDTKSVLAVVDGKDNHEYVYQQDSFLKDPIDRMFGVSSNTSETRIKDLWGVYVKFLFEQWLPIYI